MGLDEWVIGNGIYAKVGGDAVNLCVDWELGIINWDEKQ
jgi:hypothetical protein